MGFGKWGPAAGHLPLGPLQAYDEDMLFITTLAHLAGDLGDVPVCLSARCDWTSGFICFYLTVSFSETSVDQELGYIMWVQQEVKDRLCPP